MEDSSSELPEDQRTKTAPSTTKRSALQRKTGKRASMKITRDKKEAGVIRVPQAAATVREHKRRQVRDLRKCTTAPVDMEIDPTTPETSGLEAGAA